MGMGVNLDDSTAGMEDLDGPESVVAEINITPLTDVFLVLLIIFMVTTTAVIDADKAAREGVKVALPQADAAGPVTTKRAVPVLTITTANELYLFSRKIEAANLEQELKKALTDGNSDTLLLRGDKKVMLGSAVDIMSIAKRAGRQEHRHPDATGQVAACCRQQPPHVRGRGRVQKRPTAPRDGPPVFSAARNFWAFSDSGAHEGTGHIPCRYARDAAGSQPARTQKERPMKLTRTIVLGIAFLMPSSALLAGDKPAADKAPAAAPATRPPRPKASRPKARRRPRRRRPRRRPRKKEEAPAAPAAAPAEKK